MADLKVFVDRCEPDGIHGWADQGGPVPSLVIKLGERKLCDLSPTSFRADLRDNGVGDGKRAFSFPLSGYLSNGLNTITVSVGSKEVYRKPLLIFEGARENGADFGDDPELLNYSQTRWKADEPPEGLTWGRLMDGATLWRLYQTEWRFRPTHRILEIGPGYGRLLRTALDQKVPFASYDGVELSDRRVGQLRAKYKNKGVSFHTGSADDWKGTAPFDAILCSVMFDFLYPDCRKALHNLRKQIVPTGVAFIDFMRIDKSHAGFEDNGTFIRGYSETELRDIFTECGFSVRNIIRCILGEGEHGLVERNVVMALPEVAAKPRAAGR